MIKIRPQQTGLTGVAVTPMNLNTQLSNVLGLAMMSQARSAHVPSSEVLDAVAAQLEAAASPVSTGLLSKMMAGAAKLTEVTDIREAARGLLGDPVHIQDFSEHWFNGLKKRAGTVFNTDNYFWSPSWPIGRRLLYVQMPWRKAIASATATAAGAAVATKPRAYWSMLIESPCGDAAKAMAKWVLLRDQAALGVHLVPKELYTEKGYTQKVKWLEEKAVDIPLGRNFGGYGSLLLCVLPRLELEFFEPYRLLMKRMLTKHRVSKYMEATERYEASLNYIRKRIPLPPQLSFLASAWGKRIVVKALDGDLEGVMVPDRNGDPNDLGVTMRPPTSNSLMSMYMREHAAEMIEAAFTPANGHPTWGSSGLIDVYGLEMMLSEISGWADTWPSMASNFQWANIDATPTGFQTAGADFALTDMDDWEGNLVDYVLGLTPLLPVGNRKLLGRERRTREDFGITMNGAISAPNITMYTVPAPGAPVADSHADGIRRRYMPAYSVSEETNFTTTFVNGSAEAMHKRVCQLWYATAIPQTDPPTPPPADSFPVLPRFYPDPYKGSKALPTSPGASTVTTTSWDPFAVASADKLAELVRGAYDSITKNGSLDEVAHREGGFNMRYPVRLARAYTFAIADEEAGYFVRTEVTEGQVAFTDNTEVTMSRVGEAAVRAIMEMVPVNAPAAVKDIESRGAVE